MHNLKQFSGDSINGLESKYSLKNFDLSDYCRILSNVGIWIYQGMTKLMEEEIQPFVVPAVLEHEGIPGVEMPPSTRPKGSSTSPQRSVDPKEALDGLLRLFNHFHGLLTKHGVDAEVVSQVFRQLLYFVCACSMNNLVLRKDMCNWSRGLQIRYNVSQLEQWARDAGVHTDQSRVIDSMLPIVQASQLLQGRKSSEEDVRATCELASKLRVAQVMKILHQYTPADDFDRIPASFLAGIQEALKERAATEIGQQVRLRLIILRMTITIALLTF